MEKKEVPTLDDILKGNVIKTKYQKLIESEPPKEWVEEMTDEITGEKFLGLPKLKMIELRDTIYPWADVKIKDTNILQNNVTVTVTVTVGHPESEFNTIEMDGIGACTRIGNKLELQTLLQFASSNAEMNAMRKLGKFFGRDLNLELKKVVREQEKVKKQEKEEETNKTAFEEIFDSICKLTSTRSINNIYSRLDHQRLAKKISEDQYNDLVKLAGGQVMEIKSKRVEAKLKKVSESKSKIEMP